MATASTNGEAVDSSAKSLSGRSSPARRQPGGPFGPNPPLSPETLKRHYISFLLEDKPQTDVVLPPSLTPPGAIAGTGVSQFFKLDNTTGVLALGSFEEDNFDAFETTLLSGLQTLVNGGATRLIVDVVRVSSVLVNNGVFIY